MTAVDAYSRDRSDMRATVLKELLAPSNREDAR